MVKVHDLLGRQGTVVPQRTLHLYADELQVDFGKMRRLFDPETGRQRDCQALILTPVVSGYSFVWLTHRQTIEDVIAGSKRPGPSSAPRPTG